MCPVKYEAGSGDTKPSIETNITNHCSWQWKAFTNNWIEESKCSGGRQAFLGGGEEGRGKGIHTGQVGEEWDLA